MSPDSIRKNLHRYTMWVFSLTKKVYLPILNIGGDRMESIVTLISQVGFPIACCVYLFTQQNKLIQTLGEISKTLALMNQRLDDMDEKFKKAVGDYGKNV